MKMDVYSELGMPVEMEIINPVPLDARKWWTFKFTFSDGFVTVIKLDRYELKVMLSALIGSL